MRPKATKRTRRTSDFLRLITITSPTCRTEVLLSWQGVTQAEQASLSLQRWSLLAITIRVRTKSMVVPLGLTVLPSITISTTKNTRTITIKYRHSNMLGTVKEATTQFLYITGRNRVTTIAIFERYRIELLTN
jgi:hypothetical protein